MAVGDSRSRNNRTSKTTTRTTRQNYQEWERIPTTQVIPYNRDRGVPGRKIDSPVTVDGKKFDRVSRGGDGTTLMRVVRASEGGGNPLVELEYASLNDKSKTTHSSSTSFNPKDQRNAEGEKDSKSKKADIKKKGRSGLRIKLKATDPSAGRLKNQAGKKAKKKSGAQGGGKSGLNIPR